MVLGLSAINSSPLSAFNDPTVRSFQAQAGRRAGLGILQSAVNAFRGGSAPLNEALISPLKNMSVLRSGNAAAFATLIDYSQGKYDKFLSTQPKISAYLDTATTGISNVVDVLVELQDLAIEVAQAGPLDEDMQGRVNSVADLGLARIDTILDTSRVDGVAVLGLSSSLRVSDLSAGLRGVNLTAADFPGSSLSVNLNVVATAEAPVSEAFGTQALASTLKITGPAGAAFVAVPQGADAREVAARINIQTAQTGVIADENGGQATLSTEEVGAMARVTVEIVAGNFTNAAGAAFSSASASGQDAQAAFNGQSVAASGNTLFLNTGQVLATITLDEDAAPGNQSFTIAGRKGLKPGDSAPRASQSPVISRLLSKLDATPEGLGLESLRAGGENDLAANPQGALNAIGGALANLSSQLNTVEGYFSSTNTGLLSLGNSFSRNATAGLELLGPRSIHDASSQLGRVSLLLEQAVGAMPGVPRSTARILDFFF